MPKVRLLILPNGDVEAVYDDHLLRLNLGRVAEVRRASQVEFNVTHQQWEAHTVQTGQLLAVARERNACVELEKDLVHRQLKQQHDRNSSGGMATKARVGKGRSPFPQSGQ